MTVTRSVRQVDVSPEVVWRVLADHLGMPHWTPVLSARFEREGTPTRDGVGAIRVLGTPVGKIREEVVEFVENKRLVYRMLSGAPVRDYVATVELTEVGGGTKIEWTASFVPRLPGVQFAIKALIAQLAKGLAGEAAKRR